MSEEVFVSELAKIGIELNSEQICLFRKYAKFLLEYNSHTNLTAIRNVEDVYLKHFYDSLIVARFYNFNCQSVIDLGSGAGFPGVPLKIVFPSIDLTLLDSNGKKTKFLESLKDELSLDFKIINDRAEKYILGRRETYDVATSRAMASMPVLAELAIPFVKLGGYFIAYKGQLDETLENGLYAIEELGGRVERVEETLTPIEGAKRTFVFVEKKCKTDTQYPRIFDKIAKKPLQKK